MLTAIHTLDRLLRGEATRVDQMQDGAIRFPVLGVSVVVIVLGNVYGLCMAVFAMTAGGSGQAMQLVASAVKVPLLFLATLLVTFPSLYVFNALVGSRLNFASVGRLIIGTQAVTLAVLSSLGPIVGFFSLCTTSYPFIVLLNVAVFAAAGGLGSLFLLRTLHRATLSHHKLEPVAPAIPRSPEAEDASDEMSGSSADSIQPLPARPGPLDRNRPHALHANVRAVFLIWIILFGIVGAQMGWVLRPFIGSPGKEFSWFRPVESNFFEAVTGQLDRLADSSRDRAERGDHDQRSTYTR